MKSVWLFKADSSNDSYAEALKDTGNYVCESIPTLEFEYYNESCLVKALKMPEGFSGIIFTSVRAVESVNKVYECIPLSLHQEWASKKIFVVGKSTSKAIKELMNTETLGSETGNAKQLGQLIVKETLPYDKPLLYLCGNLMREELSNILKSNDRIFQSLTCYRTVKHQNLESIITRLLDSSRPLYMVFFSPSGVQFTIPILLNLKFDFSVVKIIAIGPSTSNALINNNVTVFGECPEPSPQGLLQALNLSV